MVEVNKHWKNLIVIHVLLILQKQTVEEQFPLEGEFAAVAYSSKFYLGQILQRFTEGVEEDEQPANEDDIDLVAENPEIDIRIKFLEFNKSSQTFYWPASEDIAIVEGMFVFMNQLQLKPSKNKKGHFISEPSPRYIREKYLKYKEKYDMK